jgi:type I restriction enzyme S subunit
VTHATRRGPSGQRYCVNGETLHETDAQRRTGSTVSPAASNEPWRIQRLQDVVLPVPSADPQSMDADNVIYIDISAVDNRVRALKPLYPIPRSSLPSRARRLVRAGDVIFATVRPYRRAIANIPELENVIASTAFCVLRANEQVSGRFLYYMIQSDDFMSGILPLQRGVSYPAVSDADIKNQIVRLPPIHHQRQVADKLDGLLAQLDNGIAETERAITKLLLLRQHVIDLTFDNAAALERLDTPLGIDTDVTTPWTYVQLGSVLDIANYGTSIKTTEDGSGPLVLRIPNVRQGLIEVKPSKFATAAIKVTKPDELRNDDVLVIRTNGSIAVVGQAARVRDLPNDTHFASYLIRLRVRTDAVAAEWVEQFFASSAARHAIEAGAASTSGQHNLNLRTIKGMQIPLPALGVQHCLLRTLRNKLDEINNEERQMRAVVAKATLERQNLINDSVSDNGIISPPVIQRNGANKIDQVTVNAEAEHTGATIPADTEPPSQDAPDEAYDTEWISGDLYYKHWLKGRKHSSDLVETFYAELSDKLHQKSIEVRADYDASGKKTGDLIRRTVGSVET